MIGRATRLCGRKNLPLLNENKWSNEPSHLHVAKVLSLTPGPGAACWLPAKMCQSQPSRLGQPGAHRHWRSVREGQHLQRCLPVAGRLGQPSTHPAASSSMQQRTGQLTPTSCPPCSCCRRCTSEMDKGSSQSTAGTSPLWLCKEGGGRITPGLGPCCAAACLGWGAWLGSNLCQLCTSWKGKERPRGQ